MKPYKMALPESMEERKAMSRRVQEHAFMLTWEWMEDGKTPQCLRHPFLFFDGSGYIFACSFTEIFQESENEEITPEAFLALPIPGADFLADFESGRYVVGKFWDDGDKEEHKAISVLESIMTMRTKAKFYCTGAIRCQNFEYMKTFDNPGDAEKYIRECLGI